jgi:hypothetical protein
VHVRSFVSGIAVLMCSIVLSVVLAESLLWLFPGLLPAELQQQLRVAPKNLGISHPYIGHLHRPNNSIILSGTDFRAVHHTDAHGFRNAWPWPERADIVVVGDSLVFGHGVQDTETWPGLLAWALPRSHVINLGLAAAGPPQYLRVYETFGIGLQPRVLLVGLFVRNDFWDADLFNRWLQLGGEGSYMVWRNFGKIETARFNLRDPIASIEGILTLRRYSLLHNLLGHSRNAFLSWRASEPKLVRLADGTQLQLRPNQFMSQTVGAQPDRPEFHLVLQSLTRIYAVAKENGTHPLIVFQPSKEEIYLPLLGEAAPDPGSHLRVALAKLGMAYLDTTTAFRQRAAAGESLFFEVDGHPNARGYGVIAGAVLAHLQENSKRYGLGIGEANPSGKPEAR